MNAVKFLCGIIIVALVGILCGISSTLFLYLLDVATNARLKYEWIVFLLPVAGLILGFIFWKWGQTILGGNALILRTIREDASAPIPRRMTPMVLLGSVATHLFGGSAGREGTALQMGGALADHVAIGLKSSASSRRLILTAGIAGGFGSIFGTPFAGTFFALEVQRAGSRLDYAALIPALIAALVGELTTRTLGNQFGVLHTVYPVVKSLEVSAPILGKLLILALAVALVSLLFIEVSHRLKALLQTKIPHLSLRLAFGGMIVVGLWQLCGTHDYLGLGIPGIVGAFQDATTPAFAFAWKFLFTVITLGCGFMGGEVTPLFFIGATLGNAIGTLLCLPLDMAAACGFAALFGACANTPVACVIMAVELFGTSVLPHVMLVCLVSYLLKGRRSIYATGDHSSNTPA
jgi:H+/Cl- antiporter ClcA